MAQLQEFLRNSTVAELVKLPARVIVHRTRLTPAEIAQLQSGESSDKIPLNPTTCELVVGDEIIASGRIVRRRGMHYFRVSETEEDEG